MKEIIIIVGNMGSGKSTFANALAEQMPGFAYVCLDDNRKRNFEDLLEERYNQFAFESKVAELTTKEIDKHSRVIYETTGATRFFKDVFYDLTVAKHKIYIVKIQCRPSTCLARHKSREKSGHFHIVPQFGQQLSAEELIDRFESKAAWIKPDLILDSEDNRVEVMLMRFKQAYFPTDNEKDIRELLGNFDYKAAFDWFVKNVPGKNFVKNVLATGEDNFNRQTLKKELAERLEYLKQEPTGTQSIRPTVSKTESKGQAFDPMSSVPPSLRPSVSPYTQPSEPLLSKDELRSQWSPLYREAFYIFSQLDHEPDDEKRRVMVFEILERMDEVSKIWKDQDFISKYGKLPKYDNAGMEQLTADQAATRIRTLRTYISKTKKGILKKDIPTLEKEIHDLSQHIDAI
jgi:predicted kinase